MVPHPVSLTFKPPGPVDSVQLYAVSPVVVTVCHMFLVSPPSGKMVNITLPVPIWLSGGKQLALALRCQQR